MSSRATFLTEELYIYLKNVSLREPEVLQQLREVTAPFSTSAMQISPEHGQFMRLLIKLINAKRTIEAGVYTGYSALSVALSLPEDGYMLACDINEEWTTLAREFWGKAGVAHKIELRLAPAAETLQKFIDDGYESSFDFAFIDADKGGYDVYYEQCLKLIRQGGLIMLDNMLFHGLVSDVDANDNTTKAIRAMNNKILKDERVDISLLPVGDGVTLARKK